MIRPTMRRLARSIALPATLALLPAAPTQAAVRLKPPILVRVAHDAKLGPILVKANGRTLYHFSRGQDGKIGCTAPACSSGSGCWRRRAPRSRPWRPSSGRASE